jgi:hypothetical protein
MRLPSKCEALSSNPNTTKKKKKKHYNRSKIKTTHFIFKTISMFDRLKKNINKGIKTQVDQKTYRIPLYSISASISLIYN